MDPTLWIPLRAAYAATGRRTGDSACGDEESPLWFRRTTGNTTSCFSEIEGDTKGRGARGARGVSPSPALEPLIGSASAEGAREPHPAADRGEGGNVYEEMQHTRARIEGVKRREEEAVASREYMEAQRASAERERLERELAALEVHGLGRAPRGAELHDVPEGHGAIAAPLSPLPPLGSGAGMLASTPPNPAGGTSRVGPASRDVSREISRAGSLVGEVENRPSVRFSADLTNGNVASYAKYPTGASADNIADRAVALVENLPEQCRRACSFVANHWVRTSAALRLLLLAGAAVSCFFCAAGLFRDAAYADLISRAAPQLTSTSVPYATRLGPIGIHNGFARGSTFVALSAA